MDTPNIPTIDVPNVTPVTSAVPHPQVSSPTAEKLQVAGATLIAAVTKFTSSA